LFFCASEVIVGRERERRESSSATLGVGGCFSQKVLCVCLLKKKGEKNKE
jgi:hypothetical protein